MADYYPLLGQSHHGPEDIDAGSRGRDLRSRAQGAARSIAVDAAAGARRRHRARSQGAGRSDGAAGARRLVEADRLPPQTAVPEPSPPGRESRRRAERPRRGETGSKAIRPDEVKPSRRRGRRRRLAGRGGRRSREAQRPAAPKPELEGTRRACAGWPSSPARIALVVGLVGLAAWKLRDQPEDLAKLVPAPETADQKSGGKIGERIGADNGRRAPVPANRRPAARRSFRWPIAPPSCCRRPTSRAASKPMSDRWSGGGTSTNRGPNQQLASAVRADVDSPGRAASRCRC